jgi:hypothetical protein
MHVIVLFGSVLVTVEGSSERPFSVDSSCDNGSAQ